MGAITNSNGFFTTGKDDGKIILNDTIMKMEMNKNIENMTLKMFLKLLN